MALDKLFGNWYVAMLIVLGILSVIYLVNRYRKAQTLAKWSLYALLLIFWYGILIGVILDAISYTPVQREYSILFYIVIYILNNASPNYATMFYMLVSNDISAQSIWFSSWTSWSLDDFRQEIGLLLELVPPVIMMIRRKI